MSAAVPEFVPFVTVKCGVKSVILSPSIGHVGVGVPMITSGTGGTGAAAVVNVNVVDHGP